MAHTPFVVFRDHGQWAIKSDGVHYGPYATQREAIRAAVDAAHEAGLKGLNGQVLLQDQFRIEWTYGNDPYPPNSSDYLDPYGSSLTKRPKRARMLTLLLLSIVGVVSMTVSMAEA